ncbi:MAG: hypothetical protein EKK64_06185 [Neisseriaceae bacterium]|nr:MAG: hypothetical protein EKK64_06185 [Neisseriaceae bacterium]
MEFSILLKENKENKEKIEIIKKKIKLLGGKNIREEKQEISIFKEENIMLIFNATKEFDINEINF